MTEFSYNLDGDLTWVIYPDGTQKMFSYDSQGLLVSELNPRMGETKYEYNSFGRIAAIIDRFFPLQRIRQ